MTDIISISDCLKRLESGEIVELEVWKYDRNRKMGGDVDGFSCQLLRGDADDADKNVGEVLNLADVATTTEPLSKNAHHGHWYTRNVRIIANGHPTAIIRKIHPPLIKSLNEVKTVA